MMKRILLVLSVILILAVGANRAWAQAHGEHPAQGPGAHRVETPAGQPLHGVEASGDHGDTEHAKPGLLPDPASPQTWYSALWVVIIFVVLLAILYPTAWKSVLMGLKNREDRIRKDIADAEATRARAETTLKEYSSRLEAAEQQVREMINRAAAEGERVAAGIRAHSQQEAEEIKERAQREIEASKKQAITEIYQQAADLSVSVAEKILRRNLNPDDQRQLVNQSLEQLHTLNR